MASPVVPADFAAAVPSSADTPCDAFTKLITMASLTSQLAGWMLKTDGSLTAEFLTEIGTSTAGLGAPSGLSATDDRTADITLTWASVTGATSYSIYRGTTSVAADMTLVQSGATTTTYVDTGATADVVYWYAVKAHSATQISAFSTTTDGKKPTSSAAQYILENPGEPFQFTVPSGKTAMEVRLWGGGGNGGYPDGWGVLGQPTPYGGGGAGGSFYRVTGIAVSAGEVYHVVVGKRSAEESNGDTIVFRTTVGSSYEVRATAGGNGANASDGTNDGAAGALPATKGSNSMGSGSVATQTFGTAGSGHTGGAGATYSSVTAGAGANGTGGGTLAVGGKLPSRATTYGGAGRAEIYLT